MLIPSIESSLVDRSNRVHMLIGLDMHTMQQRLDQLEDCCLGQSRTENNTHQLTGSGQYHYTQQDIEAIHVNRNNVAKRDIKLIPTGEFGVMDMALTSEGDLLHDSGLETAVIISLFSDQRYENTRGHWADELIGRASGSLLWLLKREKETTAVLRRAEDYSKQALKWMLGQRIAIGIEINARWSSKGYLRLRIEFDLIVGTVFHRHYQ